MPPAEARSRFDPAQPGVVVGGAVLGVGVGAPGRDLAPRLGLGGGGLAAVVS